MIPIKQPPRDPITLSEDDPLIMLGKISETIRYMDPNQDSMESIRVVFFFNFVSLRFTHWLLIEPPWMLQAS